MSLDPGNFWKLIGGLYATASLATFVAFGWDKGAAVRQKRRIPEKVLHGLELIGGWPGALLGMAVFKHKRSKAAYAVVTGAIVVLHLILWMWLFGVFDGAQ